MYLCNVCNYFSMKVFKHVCKYVSMYVCISVCQYVCLSVCLSVCMSVCMYVPALDFASVHFLIFRVHHRLRYWSGLIGGLATMEVLMLQGAKKFTPYVTCEFRRAYCVYRSALNILADRAIQQGEAKYHMRPKVHMLGHLVWHFVPKKPRYLMVYADEDMIARTKRIAEKSHPAYMSRLTLFRYIVQTCMRFAGVLQEDVRA